MARCTISSDLPKIDCSAQARPSMYQVQVLIPDKIVFNGIVYQMAEIDKDVIKFRSTSLSLCELWLEHSFYGRLMADFAVFGSRMLKVGVINGKVVHLSEIPDHLKETIGAIDVVESRLEEIAKSLVDAID